MFKPVVFFLSKSEPGGMVGKRGRQHSSGTMALRWLWGGAGAHGAARAGRGSMALCRQGSQAGPAMGGRGLLLKDGDSAAGCPRTVTDHNLSFLQRTAPTAVRGKLSSFPSLLQHGGCVPLFHLP